MASSFIRSGPHVYKTVSFQKTTRWQLWSTIQPGISQALRAPFTVLASLPSKVHEHLHFHDDENFSAEDQNAENIILRDTFDFLFSNASSLSMVSEMLQRRDSAGAFVVSSHLHTDKRFCSHRLFLLCDLILYLKLICNYYLLL